MTWTSYRSVRIVSTGGYHARPFSGKRVESHDRELGDTNGLQTLAIETSCDDTSVAVLTVYQSNLDSNDFKTRVDFHETVTAKSEQYGGIHPIAALESHQRELAPLVQRALGTLQERSKHNDYDGLELRRPDFVTVTRGPGMRSNLAVGLNMAKGLATAWEVPLVGVHHMQAHALTARLCSVLQSTEGEVVYSNKSDDSAMEFWEPEDIEPRFPFLSVLVSGGHTMLIDSKSLTKHSILAETADIAIGDFLDKAARAILPPDALKAPFGKALEDFAFPQNDVDNAPIYDYEPPARRQDEMEALATEWDWSLAPPLSESKSGDKSSRRMMYSFAGLLTSVERLAARDMGMDERRDLAREVQRVAFEHLASRILLHLTSETTTRETIVVSGGVASNTLLRHVLRSILDVRGYEHVELIFPPVELCTDNALMIAWAGMEMYDAGYESELSIAPLRKWSMDPRAEDGGIVGVGGWKSPLPEEEDENEESEEAIDDDEDANTSNIEPKNKEPEWGATVAWVMVGFATMSYFIWKKQVPSVDNMPANPLLDPETARSNIKAARRNVEDDRRHFEAARKREG